MYIGPWQEFKLAKILQIKDKLEQEERENNQIEIQQKSKGKALSTGHARTNLKTNEEIDLRKQSRQDLRRQQASSEYMYKYKVDPQYLPPPKQIPVLKPINHKGLKQGVQVIYHHKHGVGQAMGKGSPPGSNYSYNISNNNSST